MSRISEVFKNGPAFIPYISAGDPNLEATESFIQVLEEAGADIIELGVPFSDPMADGPTNQKAAMRALKSGTTLYKILQMIQNQRKAGCSIPIVLFSYYNPILNFGLQPFALAAKEAGVDGVLVLDLPPEEAQDYLAPMRKAQIDTIFLLSPTSSADRIELVNEHSTGFIYFVSRTGVTGVSESLHTDLEVQIIRLKKIVNQPIAVGFGISTPDQARTVASISDGVVVGSALVNLIASNPKVDHAKQALAEKAKLLAMSIKEK